MDSAGGSVRVRYKPGIVEFVAAFPNAGFRTDIEQQSPEVEVEFTNDDTDTEIEVRVRWYEGELDIDINES